MNTDSGESIKNQIFKKEIDSHLEAIKSLIDLKKEIFILEDKIAETFKNKNKILICGNGGSAADAQHLSSELVGRYEKERHGFPAFSLSTDVSALTALGNDYGFESIFSRQIQGIGKENDLLIGISTSGNSANIIAAIKQAKFKGLKTISFTGKTGGKMSSLADVNIFVPSENTQRIQESHIMIGQILCGLLEKNVFS